jgi:AcrR family transcriptional regulator
MPTPSLRARPLPPEERRAALVASTLPLVLAFGPNVSTRQIAQAAGVAEGTIFRVFASKAELVNAAVASAFDAGPEVAELARIPRSAPLSARLLQAVEILQQRFARVFRLMDALGVARALKLDRGPQAVPTQRALVVQALAGLMEAGGEELRCAPGEAARRLWLLTFAGSHPRLVDDEPLSPAEIVSTLLDGIRRPPTASPGGPSC